MQQLSVDLPDTSYPIFIGPCLENADLIDQFATHKEIAVVTNETIAPLYLERINDLLSETEDRKIIQVVLPDGEQYKNLETVNLIFDALLENNFSRKCCLVALGGGVIGDMTGFAAASYQRGVDFIQIPTTTLSQVDSSVGGKTGVNHPLGKNMIGAFKQPLAVLIDTQTLKTLPERDFSAGYAEMLKHGLIYDVDYFHWLDQHVDRIFALEDEFIEKAIYESCRIKSEVVSQDETEQGIRALLNLGHTFGHAIETSLGYGEWLHGEAVGFGLLMAAYMSSEMKLIDSNDVESVRVALNRGKLPTSAPKAMTPEKFMKAMYRDKKVDAGSLRLILLRELGDAYITGDFSEFALQNTLDYFCNSKNVAS